MPRPTSAHQWTVHVCACTVRRKWLAHPGELFAAEEAAEATQRRALEGLPQEMLERVIVAATAHTDEATFLYNQPTIQKRPGATGGPSASHAVTANAAFLKATLLSRQFTWYRPEGMAIPLQ